MDQENDYNGYDTNIYYVDLLNGEDYSDIRFLHKSEEKVVIEDKKVKKKLLITKESIGNIKELEKNNSNIKAMNGFGYKIGDYIELDLSRFISLNLIDYYTLDSCITFYIGNVEIVIRSSSGLYRLLKNLEYGFETYTDDYLITMSLRGVTSDNYSGYFNMALYILWNIPKDDNNISIEEYIAAHVNGVKFDGIRFSEVYHFYNEAMRIFNTEISTLYFYKIIEYFFLVIRKEEFKNIIDNYLADKNIDFVMNRIIKIYKEQELSQLTLLLKSIEDSIGNILDGATCLQIIRNPDVVYLAEKLYEYRNSVVHGKSGEKFDLKLPNPLIIDGEELFWRNSIKNIAEILITKICIKSF